jgi:hypothetical protein
MPYNYKYSITEEQWGMLSKNATKVIINWLWRTGNYAHHNLSLGEVIHLLQDLGNRYRKDQPIEQFSYNNVMEMNDSAIGWDSCDTDASLIDTLWQEVMFLIDRPIR